MNSVQLIGRITKEPEMNKTNSGKNYVRFSLAVDRGLKTSNGERETDFINCIAWEKTAEYMNQYIHKGYRLGIEGRIQTGSYTDQQGNNRTTFDVFANRVENLEPKREEQPNQSDVYVREEDNDYEASDDDLPF